MRMDLRVNLSRSLMGLFLVLGFVGLEAAAQYDSVVYLKNNIHAQRRGGDAKASYANWTNPGEGHFIVEVNTPVMISIWKKPFVKLGFKLTNQDTGEVVHVEYKAKHMNMSQEEYIDLITSEGKVSLSGLSDIDRKGIKEGVAKKGMSKEGVRIALGYPATHRTPSLDSDTWIYWTNRFNTMAVAFNDQGIVTGVRY